jgi:hypothetical protein
MRTTMTRPTKERSSKRFFGDAFKEIPHRWPGLGLGKAFTQNPRKSSHRRDNNCHSHLVLSPKVMPRCRHRAVTATADTGMVNIVTLPKQRSALLTKRQSRPSPDEDGQRERHRGRALMGTQPHRRHDCGQTKCTAHARIEEHPWARNPSAGMLAAKPRA